MSIRAVRKALETRLKTLDTSFATAYDNVKFDPTAEPYQEARLLPNTPDNSAIGGAYRRELGIFQVTLMYPLLKGAGEAEDKAVAVQNHFPRGLSLTQDGVNIVIEKTPAIGPGFRDADRWRIPVSVSYRAEVFA